MPDGAPPTSYEYGHKIDRAERSEETYRIGGLMDMIDATEILKALFTELGHGDRSEDLARAALARLTHAPDHPILACRVYEMATPDQLIAAAGLLFPLNRYTTEVLEAVADVKAPDGWQINVAADSDVVLTHVDGLSEWAAVSKRGGGPKTRWIWSRGSLGWEGHQDRIWPTLADAIAELTALEEAPDAR